MYPQLSRQTCIRIFAAGVCLVITLLLLVYQNPTLIEGGPLDYRKAFAHHQPHGDSKSRTSKKPKDYTSSKKPIINFPPAMSEDAVFRNGKLRLMKVYFDKAVVEPPGVILRLKGGTGNQLFLYACSYALARDKNWTLYTYVDRKWFPSKDHRKFRPTDREFALDQFNIPLDNLFDSSSGFRGEKQEVTDKELLEGRKELLRGVTDSNTFLELDGMAYCQSREYWKLYQQEVKEMFSLTPNLGDSDIIRITLYKMENTESVAVHVRRGDFLSNGPKGAFFVPISYQRRAIQQMAKILGKRKKVPVFFVFSDDIRGAREELKDLGSKYEILFISDNDNSGSMTSLLEFYLMTKCKHIIIPSSTFGWWAAFLNGNKDKVVIASKFNPHFFTNVYKTEKEREFRRKQFGSLFYPEEWIVIDPFKDGLKKL